MNPFSCRFNGDVAEPVTVPKHQAGILSQSFGIVRNRQRVLSDPRTATASRTCIGSGRVQQANVRPPENTTVAALADCGVSVAEGHAEVKVLDDSKWLQRTMSGL